MLEPRKAPRLPKSVAKAATSPTAVVLAGAGVGIGELAHLGLPIALFLGAVGYGARVCWAAVRARLARKRAARAAEIDPWSVPEPWRGYTLRALDARKRFRELAQGVPPGPVARELDNALSGVEAVVREQWVLSRGGAALAGPPGRAAKAARQLEAAQAALAKAGGADRAVLQSRESALASELRSARRLDAVTSQASERLATLCAQLEGLVATAGELVLSAGSGGGEVGPLSQELSALNQGLDEVRRMLPAAGDAQANGLS